MKGIITDIKPEKYIVQILDTRKKVEATKTGNVKKKIKLLVGDYVEVENIHGTDIIVDVHERKNSLIRPPMANLDQMFCIISKSYPVPDIMMLDKQLLMCEMLDITPIICINKSDEENANDVVKYIKEKYESLEYEIIDLSAKTELGINEIRKHFKSKISAFSGLSGVGKSSLIKAIFKDDINEVEVGKLTEKINRGKHTTKYVKLYNIEDGYLADTPGFSSLDLIEEIEKENLKNLYPDFLKYPCRYKDCNHVIESEEECSVKAHIGKGIDKDRYLRYKKLYEELEQKDKMKYKKASFTNKKRRKK